VLIQLLSPGATGGSLGAVDRARWLYQIYAGRLIICLAVYGSALAVEGTGLFGGGGGMPDDLRFVALVGLGLAGVATPLSYWYSHLGERSPGTGFVYGQALLDILLVTGIVHITGGSTSVFPPLFYIGLATAYALILPVPSAVGVALATGLAYLGDITLAYPAQLGVPVLLQVGIFTLVATASSVIGGKLRQSRAEVRRLQGELHRLQLEAADVLRNVGSGVMTVDEDGRAAYLNPAAESLLGLDADDWLGRDILAELGERAADLAEVIRETIRRGEAVENREVEVMRPGEARVPASVTSRLMGPEGGPKSVTVALQDLRPARRIQQLRVRANRLEAVAELSASLAHEIKNPLASIRSAAQQLGEMDGEGADPDGILTRLVVRESDRLNALLEEFGDFARVDIRERKPLDLETVAGQVIEVVRQHPDTPDPADLSLEMRDDAENLWGDPDLLHRLLLNLTLNAVQVAEPGESPRVRIVVDELRPEIEPPDVDLGSPVRVRVTDNGPGIPPEELERIFDPFYSRREGGSGLGLSIAHRAAEAHGGALFATSTPGEGATFVLVLPRRDAQRTEEEELDTATAAPGN
jgi:two-component system sensor histidine kinase PilS (NtrC family)